MRGHLSKICKTFFFVFNENSRESRVALFSEKLIQILWARFVKQQGATVRTFLQKMASSGQAALRTFNFKSDVAYLERCASF